MKKIVITVILFAAMSSLISAQSVHEFSVYGGGGLSALRYQPSQGNRNGGAGGEFGVGYTLLLDETEQWGIYTGLGLGLYNARGIIDNGKTVTKNLKDDENDKFDLHTKLSDYKETQRTMFLNIPIMGQYQVEPFYFMAGVKIGIPLNGKYTSKDATLTNEAYYPDYDVWLDVQTFKGYGKFRNRDSNGGIDLGVTVMLALEAGMKWNIGDKLLLYTGAYFDYGLNNSSKTSQQPFVNYNKNHPSDFTTNSVLSTFTEKVNIMAIGVKARLAMNL